jgi:hypothetical protein
MLSRSRLISVRDWSSFLELKLKMKTFGRQNFCNNLELTLIKNQLIFNCFYHSLIIKDLIFNKMNSFSNTFKILDQMIAKL